MRICCGHLAFSVWATRTSCLTLLYFLCAGKEHRALCSLPFHSQIKFIKDSDGEIFLHYMKDIGLKTNKGGLKHRKIEAKTVDLYATLNDNRCPLWAIIKYLAFLPKNRMCEAFYLQPRKKFFGKVWYLNRLVGLNKLCSAVRAMCQVAGLPGHYTNHSLCSTAATKLYQNNVDEQIIMEITDHQSIAVRSYKRTSKRQRKQASKCLFGEPWMHYVAPPVNHLLLHFATFIVV